MSQTLHLVGHIPTAELGRLYKEAGCAAERSHLHVIWLLSIGFTVKLTADVIGFTPRQLSELIGRYNRPGLDGLPIASASTGTPGEYPTETADLLFTWLNVKRRVGQLEDMLRPCFQSRAFGVGVIRPCIPGGDAGDGTFTMIQHARDRLAADTQFSHASGSRATEIMQGPPGDACSSINGGLRLLEVCVAAAVAFGRKHVIYTGEARHRRQHLPCDR